MHPIGPTNPYHIARAYGLREPNAAGAMRSVSASGASEPASRADHARLNHSQSGAEAARGKVSNIHRIVAGTVPGGIDFIDGVPRPTQADRLRMYADPAQQNAAATRVASPTDADRAAEAASPTSFTLGRYVDLKA